MNVVSWLRADTWPGDCYELLGFRRFEPATQDLLGAIRHANRQVWAYQNHEDATVRSRALRMLRELGHAEDTFSDLAKRDGHDATLARALLDEFKKAEGVRQWADHLPRLRTWLIESKQVHPDGIGRVLAELPTVLVTNPDAPLLPATEPDVDVDLDGDDAPGAYLLEPTWDDGQAGLSEIEPVTLATAPAPPPQAPVPGRRNEDDDPGTDQTIWLDPVSPGDARRRLVTLALLLLLLPVALMVAVRTYRVVSTRDAPRTARAARLLVIAEGGPTRVLVDGEPRPADAWNRFSMELPPGRHQVQVYWGTQTRTEELWLWPGNFRSLTIARRDGQPTKDGPGRDVAPAYARARARLAERQFGVARREFDAIIQRAPEFAGALAGRGTCALRLGDFTAARADFEAAIAREPGSLEALVGLGDACLETGDLAAARRQFDAALELDPRCAEARAGLGLAYFYEGDLRKAVAASDDAIAMDRNSVRAYLVRAAGREESGQFNAALADCREALNRDPLAVAALAIRTEAYGHLRARNQASTAARQAFALPPPLTALELNYMYEVHLRMGDGARGRAALEQALRQVPGFVVAMGNRSWDLYSREKRPDLALKEIDKALSLAAGIPDLFNHRSRYRLDLGQTDGALEDAKTAVRLAPGVPHYLVQRGRVHLRRNDAAGARDDLEAARKLDDKDPSLYMALAVAYVQAESFEQAIELHRRAIQLDAAYSNQPIPLNLAAMAADDRRVARLVSAYLSDGDACQKANDTVRALWAFSAAIRTQPGDPKSYRRRAYLYTAGLDRPGDARRDLEAALKIDPGDAPTHDQLGLVLKQLRSVDLAIAEFGQAIDKDPDLAIARLHRGSTYCEQRNFQDAIPDLERAIDLRLKLPDDHARALALYNRGRAYMETGQETKAAADFQKAIEIDNFNPEPFFYRGYLYLKERQNNNILKNAMKYLGRAVDLDPSNARYHYYLGKAAYLLRDAKRATLEYQKAQKLDRNNPEFKPYDDARGGSRK
jgi:tetratricopeptide (TPR) repeat protein